MEIIKAFENNELSMNISILGTYEEPLFRASDIGAILEISNIRQTIKDFDETEKGVRIADTLGGSQEVTFLTEKGLYQVLFTSRKPIAKKFKNWVCEVIKELRLKGSYELKKQLAEKDEEIKKVIKDKDNQRENIILDNFEDSTAVYIAYADKTKKIAKPGLTSRVTGRLSQHRATYGQDFNYEYIHESLYAAEIERRLFKNPEMAKRRFEKEYSGKNRTELFHLDETFTLADINKLVIQIKKEVEIEEFNKDKDSEINLLKLAIADLKLENEKLKTKIDQTSEEYLKAPKIITHKTQVFDQNKFFLLFLRSISKTNDNALNISGAALYENYKTFTFSNNSDPLSPFTFNTKIKECPCILNTRIRLDKNDPEYKSGADNRKKINRIDIRQLIKWLDVYQLDKDADTVEIVEDKINHFNDNDISDTREHNNKVAEDNERKYGIFLLFLKEIIKNKNHEDTISIESIEFFKKYLEFISDNNYKDTDTYTDTRFNRYIIKKCPVIYDSRIKNSEKIRKTHRNFSVKLLDKWIKENNLCN